MAKKQKITCGSVSMQEGCGGMFYILAFIGAAAYYIVTAGSFWTGVLGVLKALVWPIFLLFHLLKFLGA